MHYAHVKRKEKTMNRNILEELYSDPDAYQRMVERAHRERSRAIGAGVRAALGALAGLRQRLAARFDLRPGHWMERLG
jgi:hypothetical protein